MGGEGRRAYHDEGFPRERDAVLLRELGHEGPVAVDDFPLREGLLRSGRAGSGLCHPSLVSLFFSLSSRCHSPGAAKPPFLLGRVV